MKVLLTTIKTGCPKSQLTLKYLYGILLDAPIELSLKEYEPERLTSDIYSEIVSEQYNVIYLHCDECNEARISAIAELLKKALPTSVVMIGGSHVSFGTRRFMEENPCVDFVVRGEPEKVMFNFIKTLITYEFDFESIAGLAYRENDKVHVNPLDQPVAIEELPFPYEKIDLRPESEVYYETMRGSSDRSACAQLMPDERVRSLSLNRICTELRYFLVKQTKRLIITDKYFNYNVERAYRIWEYLINNDSGQTSFVFNVDGDLLDDETVRLLEGAREGLFEFNVDIDSSNAETLSAIGKKENIYQLFYNVSRLLQKTNVKVNASMKMGLPLENEKLFARSFNKIFGLGATSLRVSTLRMNKGSELRARADQYGYQYNSRAPYEVVANDYINALDMIKLKDMAAVVDIYSGHGGFDESIQRMMMDCDMKPYDFFKRLAEFITHNGYKKNLRKQSDLYRILYAYATEIYDELNDTIKLQILMNIIHSDLEKALPEDAVKKFEKKGWNLES